MPREEWDLDRLTRCEFIDLAHGYYEGEEWPERWTCPRCGGSEFEFVHADYQESGVRPGAFEADVEPEE